ncbi:MAG: hypothetical protein J5806_00645, partial [Lentisphaeria bacterium]|nr:hypothetical protein [Lentisphaeria bacterium]
DENFPNIFTCLALRAQSRSCASEQINSDLRGIRLAVKRRLTVARQFVIFTRFTAKKVHFQGTALTVPTTDNIFIGADFFKRIPKKTALRRFVPRMSLN